MLNRIVGTPESESLLGTSGNDEIFGGDGADLILPEGGDDIAYGEAGNDRVYGLAGNDTLYGGAGNDRLSGNSGNDLIYGGDGDDEIFLSVEPGLSEADDGDDRMYGEAGNDRIYGGPGADQLFGGTGSDELFGGVGDDLLDGGPGADELYGEDGNDRYVVDDLFDLVYDRRGTNSGTIMVDFYKKTSSVEWTLAPGFAALPYWIDALTWVDGTSSLADFAQPIIAAGRVVEYSFATLADPSWSERHRKGFEPFTDVQKRYVRNALAAISSVIDLNFREVDNQSKPGVLLFANNSQESSGAYQVGDPGTSLWGVFVNADGASRTTNLNPIPGNYGALSILHEIGHALGLKHPFSRLDADGNAGEAPYLGDVEDNVDITIMAYARTARPSYPSQLQDFDIAALQYLYGANRSASSGANSYILSTIRDNFVWDSGGEDTLDARDAGKPLVLSLEQGRHSYFGAAAEALISADGQITINIGTVIENAIGTRFDDRIEGNAVANRLSGEAGADRLAGGAGNDILVGGAGNDLLDGGAGDDVALFADAYLEARFAIEAGQLIVTTATEGSDRLLAIEALRFADRTVALVSLLRDLAPASFRLVAEDGFAGSIGGSGSVTGTRGFQDLRLVDRVGSISLDPSFNAGGDLVRLPGKAADWTIQRVGSNARLVSESLAVTIPIGTVGTELLFADGIRRLAYADGAFKIGTQAFTEVAGAILAPDQGTVIKSGALDIAGARLVLAEGGEVAIGGRVQLIGTRDGRETIEALGGTLGFDPSFNAGGDRIDLPGKVAAFTATRSGSSMILRSGADSYSIPVGTVGTDLAFDDAARTLLYAGGQFRIGTQAIEGTGAVALIA